MIVATVERMGKSAAANREKYAIGLLELSMHP